MGTGPLTLIEIRQVLSAIRTDLIALSCTVTNDTDNGAKMSSSLEKKDLRAFIVIFFLISSCQTDKRFQGTP